MAKLSLAISAIRRQWGAVDLVGEGVKSGWLGANVRCFRG